MTKKFTSSFAGSVLAGSAFALMAGATSGCTRG